MIAISPPPVTLRPMSVFVTTDDWRKPKTASR